MNMLEIPDGFTANAKLRDKINADLGIKGNKFKGIMVWKKCPQCEKRRWVRLSKLDSVCTSCHAKYSKRKDWPEGYEILVGAEYKKRFGCKTSNRTMIFYPCKNCGAKHWMALCDLKRKTATKICRNCFNKYMSYTKGEARWNWKKACRYKDNRGYITIRLPKNDPFFCMTDAGQKVLEHRYVMAESLNRPLTRWEIVHHKNNIKDDNRIENLQLVTLSNHRGQITCPHCGKEYTAQ